MVLCRAREGQHRRRLCQSAKPGTKSRGDGQHFVRPWHGRFWEHPHHLLHRCRMPVVGRGCLMHRQFCSGRRRLQLLSFPRVASSVPFGHMLDLTLLHRAIRYSNLAGGSPGPQLAFSVSKIALRSPSAVPRYPPVTRDPLSNVQAFSHRHSCQVRYLLQRTVFAFSAVLHEAHADVNLRERIGPRRWACAPIEHHSAPRTRSFAPARYLR